jgi:hypothetical protein
MYNRVYYVTSETRPAETAHHVEPSISWIVWKAFSCVLYVHIFPRALRARADVAKSNTVQRWFHQNM